MAERNDEINEMLERDTRHDGIKIENLMLGGRDHRFNVRCADLGPAEEH